MIHDAIALASPGDVLVIDGAVRDRDELEALGVSVVAVGIHPNGPTKNVADEARRMGEIQRGDTSASWLEGALRTAGALTKSEIVA